MEFQSFIVSVIRSLQFSTDVNQTSVTVSTLGGEEEKVPFSFKSEYSDLTAVKVNSDLFIAKSIMYTYLNLQQHRQPPPCILAYFP